MEKGNIVSEPDGATWFSELRWTTLHQKPAKERDALGICRFLQQELYVPCRRIPLARFGFPPETSSTHSKIAAATVFLIGSLLALSPSTR